MGWNSRAWQGNGRGVGGEEERGKGGRAGLRVLTGGSRGHWKSRWTTLEQPRHGAPTAAQGGWVTGQSSPGRGVGAPTLPACESGAALMGTEAVPQWGEGWDGLFSLDWASPQIKCV